jgi:hypothetical protein
MKQGRVHVERSDNLAKSASRFALVVFLIFIAVLRTTAAQDAQSSAAAKPSSILGTIKNISDSTLTVDNDAGTETKVTVESTTKLMRLPVGSKDLTQATPLQLSDLQVGDRILVRQRCGADPATCTVTAVIAMKKEDIAAKQARERQEWQQHGIGGLVKSNDVALGVLTIGTLTATGPKDVAIHIAKTTVIRRYAPGSVKFDDAQISSLADIKSGDQLRARGTRSPDGADFAADEIVTGSFRNIAGTISSLDTGAGTITIADLATSKSVQVKISGDSQLRKLPQPMAQRIAMRLKGEPVPAASGASGSAAAPAPGSTPGAPAANAGAGPGAASSSGPGMGGMGGAPRNASGDLQQMLSRLPASTLSDFQKGDAVMIVATSSQNDGQVTAITLLGGVEPLLQASPKGQAASILSPWSLGSGGADAGGQ